jgi:ankyrin repeat protein|tara:strand:+ start:2019 stop:2585 length:567 start_codon:yes stop_codon:yes gene_type:complete
MVTIGCDSQQSEQVVNPDSKPKSIPLTPTKTEAPSLSEKSNSSNESGEKGRTEIQKKEGEASGVSPKYDIFRSAGSGDIDAVKYHLANQVKLNTQDKTGKTPLLWAIRSKEHEIVYYLLDNGADPNISDKKKVTPLFWAVRMGRPELVTALLNKGADIKLRDFQGKDVFDYVKDETIVEILRRHRKKL